jgi:hypothetical protein
VQSLFHFTVVGSTIHTQFISYNCAHLKCRYFFLALSYEHQVQRYVSWDETNDYTVTDHCAVWIWAQQQKQQQQQQQQQQQHFISLS